MDVDTVIDEAIHSWDKAEEVIKKAENAMIDSYVPAINELRYGGRSLISAWKEMRNGNSSEVERFCTTVRHNARCAEHDAVDGLILFVKKEMRTGLGRFGEIRISEKFSDFAKLQDLLNNIDPNVAATRGDHKLRPTTYSEIQDGVIDELIVLYSGMMSAIYDLAGEDDQLADLLEEAKKEIKAKEIELAAEHQRLTRANVLAFVSLVVTVASIVVGVVSIG